MPQRPLKIQPHLPLRDIQHRYKNCPSIKEKMRWQVIWLMSKHPDFTVQHIAEITGFTEVWVRKIVHRWNEDGPNGLMDGHRHNPGGKRKSLSDEQAEVLQKALLDAPPGGGRWTANTISEWIENHLQVKMHPVTAWSYVKRLDFIYQQIYGEPMPIYRPEKA
ncbi:helix-turn-helix domain-containing protein [Deinococcus misasensis]|uniref:helix-turn-helix domain-containing protein n=1 Tax=Deinococcus misasensis TaxID=392413 RepID=UPI00054D8E21|nr:helix-turn-helix domain-containing protein [Deinococcus misasensis]